MQKNKYKTVLKLKNSSEKNFTISIQMIESDIPAMALYDLGKVIVTLNKKNYVLAGSIIVIKDIINTCIKQFSACLQNKRPLHQSIVHPMGYLDSVYMNKDKTEREQLEKDAEEYQKWCTGKYNFFQGAQNSWLYNDADSNIIFEISERSPYVNWIDSGLTPKKEAKALEQWLKNFKPILVTKIDRESAQEWLKLLKNFMARLRRSDKKYRCTGPGCVHCTKENKAWYCRCKREHKCPPRNPENT